MGFDLSAPLTAGISNHFIEDLKKIADLKPLLEDYLPTQNVGRRAVQGIRIGTIDPVLTHFRATGRDFGREMILPY